jgi:hypothetical protein
LKVGTKSKFVLSPTLVLGILVWSGNRREKEEGIKSSSQEETHIQSQGDFVWRLVIEDDTRCMHSSVQHLSDLKAEMLFTKLFNLYTRDL